MDVKRNSKTIGKQAKLVEITEMTVDKIQFNIGIGRRLFRHILVSSGVGIKVIVVDCFGKCFCLLISETRVLGLFSLTLGFKPEVS